MELDESGVRLIPWAYVEGAGHFLYWLVREGVEPEEWTVILNEGRGPLWEAAPVSCSRYLLDVMTGTADSLYFSGPEDPDQTCAQENLSRFRPNSEILLG